MPKISIITTTYKHQDFIKATIESVLSQTYTDWELLIGDDSPDDLTWNIIQEYLKKYPDKIKAWHHNPNKGIVDNMNFLLEKVSNESEYIAFLEGDDMFTSDNLKEKIKVFEEYKEVGMVYNNLDFIDENGKVFYKDYLKKTPFYLKNEKLSEENFLKYDTFYLSYSSLMIKKEVLEKEKIINPTSDKLYSVSDWDLFFRISTKYNCYGIKESLTLYRKHKNNLTFLNDTKICKDLLIILQTNKKITELTIYNYKINHLKTYINYLEKNKLETIKYGLLSFKYSLKQNVIKRVGMIVFSLLPNKLNDFLYNKLKK